MLLRAYMFLLDIEDDEDWQRKLAALASSETKLRAGPESARESMHFAHPFPIKVSKGQGAPVLVEFESRARLKG